MEYQPKWHESISPTSQLRGAIYQVTKLGAALGICDRPYDPFEAILKPICGDWVGMARTGRVLDQVSRCVRDVGANQGWAAQCLRTAWTGNAADAAAAHLFRLAKSLQTTSETLFQLGRVYGTAAQGAFNLADTIGSLLSAIGDAAISAAASAAVAGGAASTGVGLPVAAIAGLVGVVEVTRVIDGVVNVIDLVGKFDTIISTAKSGMSHFGRIDGDYPLPELPAVSALPR